VLPPSNQNTKFPIHLLCHYTNVGGHFLPSGMSVFSLGNRLAEVFNCNCKIIEHYKYCDVHVDVGSGVQVSQAGGYCSAAPAAGHPHQQGRHGQPYSAGYAQTLPASSQYRQQPHSQTGSPQVTMVNGQIDCTDDQR